MALNSIETYQSLGLATSADKVEPVKQELGQEEFLKLMTTQMTHQDPNSPMENGDFLAQMAQFSTVEGVGRLNDSFTEFATSITSGQSLQAAALVGQSVMVPADKGSLTLTEKLSGEAILSDNTSNLSVKFLDTEGQIVKTINLGQQSEGNVRFEWDGRLDDGSFVNPGQYSIRAEAKIDGNNTMLQTYVNANVNSVALGGKNEGITLDLEGMGKVDFNEVKKIF